MKTTKKQLKEIAELEKRVSEVCDTQIKPVAGSTNLGFNAKGEPIQVVVTDFRKEQKNEKKSRNIEISLGFGKSAPTIKIQLKEQGFKLPNGLVKDAEKVRVDLLALKDIRILNGKQLMKCFKKLSREISQRVVDSVIQEDETAIHIKTKQVN
jgi:hypothetical protein